MSTKDKILEYLRDRYPNTASSEDTARDLEITFDAARSCLNRLVNIGKVSRFRKGDLLTYAWTSDGLSESQEKMRPMSLSTSLSTSEVLEYLRRLSPDGLEILEALIQELRNRAN